MEMGEAIDGLGPVEGQDRVEVTTQHLVARHLLPALALVGTQVLDVEGLAVWDVQKALACGVDGEAAQITPDPAAPELLGGDKSCSRTAEQVRNEISRVARRLDDPVEKGLGLLRGVA
jgi:hypothetical protein